MPLITVSHFFAPSAGIRPGNAVLTGFAEIPMRFAIAFAMSTSNPKIDPLDFVSSIGGNVGSVQNVSVLIGAARCAAPTPPAIPSDSASSASTVVSRFISPPRWEKRSLLRRLGLVAVGARFGGRRGGVGRRAPAAAAARSIRLLVDLDVAGGGNAARRLQLAADPEPHGIDAGARLARV